ncbi:hypothetical protein [Chryseobacterium sp.]|uniref:hypothetical protein n=1 Tax=Chryseobacterium sp. TaxID=1871047 RepID=UPI00289AC670|nr:hypothetical protein [Chryseobacterium sp.]
MKNVLKSVLLTGFLLISASFMSKDKDFSLSIGSISATTLNFEVSNAKNISLSIYSEKGGELFSENLENTESFVKSYDLKSLEMGTYFLVAESDQKVEKYKININYKNEVSIEKKPVSQIKKPVYKITGNVVNMMMEGMRNSAVISVSDFAGNVYYNETKNADGGNLSLTFELNPFNASKYMITVEDEGNVFNKIITLN